MTLSIEQAREIIALYPAEDTDEVLKRRTELFYLHPPDTDTSYTWDQLIEKAMGFVEGWDAAIAKFKDLTTEFHACKRHDAGDGLCCRCSESFFDLIESLSPPSEERKIK